MIFKVNGNKLGLSIFGLTDKISSIKKEVSNAAQAVSDYNNYIANISNPTRSAPFLKNLQNTSGAFKDYTKTLNGAKASLNGFTDYLVVTNAKTKLLSFGIQALNFAIKAVGMTLLSIGISKFVESLQEAKANQEALTNELIESGEEAENTNNKISDLISTYQQLVKSGGSADELKNLQEQIAELVGVQADNLDLVNGKLDEELKKLQEISSAEAQSNRDALVGRRNATATTLLDEWNKWSFSDSMPSDYFADEFSSKIVDYITSQMPEFTRNNTGLLVGLEGFVFNSDMIPEFESQADKIVWMYNKVLEAKTLLDKSYEQDDLSTNDLYKNITSWLGKYKDEVEAYSNALDAFNQNEAIIAVGENLKTFTGEINDQTSFDNWVKGIIDAEGATGDYADAIWEVCESRYPQFKKQTDEVGDSAYKASFQIQSLSSSLSELEKISDKFSKLGSAISELKEDGYVSIKTINEIAEAFKGTEGLDNYISQIAIASNTTQLQNSIQGLINSYLNQKSVLKGLDDANKQVLITQLQRLGVTNAEEIVNAKINQNLPGLTQNMKDFSKHTSQEAASLYALAKGSNIAGTELKKYAQIVEKVNEIERLEAEAKKSQAYDSHIYAWRINNIRKEISDIVDSINISPMNTDVKIKISMSGLEDLSGSGNSGKTEAEKYFDELKYKLDTNKITQEQYLKDLDWGYKHFYNKTAEYLEDYAKYSQEVYDGFKDMYKEDLEAQKDAWEEKKDAVSEYYDKLREEIENTHDKEDYEKEQSEKRKEIFDLDMQIAELMRDGSEKAKARIAELEEERLKAEEELRDFETDKAREDELSRLEKEQKAEEDKIQQQIDGIQGQLDNLDKDTVSVRNAIIAYAKEKGVTLNFAYASGTRSSVGGFGRINEKGIEMISAPDGNGNYVNLIPGSYVFSAKATEFLWKLATEHSLPQAMYNSIAKSIKTQSGTPSVNIAQPITITMGDIIIKGNADKQTVFEIKKQRESDLRWMLEKIKELQK